MSHVSILCLTLLSSVESFVLCQCLMSVSYVSVICRVLYPMSSSVVFGRLLSSLSLHKPYVQTYVIVRHKPRHKTLTLKDEICSYNNQESQHREKVRKRREKVRKRREQPHSGLFKDVYCNHTGPYLVSTCIMCCSVLLCVAVCCSVLLCCSVAVCCSVCPYLVSRYITT